MTEYLHWISLFSCLQRAEVHPVAGYFRVAVGRVDRPSRPQVANRMSMASSRIAYMLSA